MTEEAAHHPLGASAAERWLRCPGSVLATKDLPDTDTEYSTLGTAAHTLAERCRKDNLPTKHFLGDKIFVEQVDGSSVPVVVDKEMVDSVQAFIDYINALPGDDYNESRVYFNTWIPGAFGTMDAAKATTHHLEIIDLKYGAGVEVGAYRNPQLMLYALGFLESWGWMYSIRTVRITVFQPRLDNIASDDLTVEELLKWAEEVVRPGAIKALTPGAPFNPGKKACAFCKIRRTCAARARHVFEMNLEDELDDLTTAIEKDAPPLIHLTNDQIAAALRRKSHVTKWYADIEAHAKSEIAAGRAVGNFKMVEGRSSRTWVLPAKEIEKRFVAAGLDEGLHAKLYTEPELISAPQAEKVFGKKYFASATEKKEAGVLADLITKPKGKPVLVPGEDPREPMVVGADELEDVSDDAD